MGISYSCKMFVVVTDLMAVMVLPMLLQVDGQLHSCTVLDIPQIDSKILSEPNRHIQTLLTKTLFWTTETKKRKIQT